MDHPGLDPSTALQLIQTLLYAVACILGGSVLLGLSAYIVFLCFKIFSPQPSSRTRLGEVPHPVGCAPVAQENLELVAAETPILAAAESLSGEVVWVPALSHDEQTRMNSVSVALESEPTGARRFLDFPRLRRAVVLDKQRSSLGAKTQLEKLA